MSESQTSIELPVFDISQPLHPSSLSSLFLACKEWGFFHISNHGVPMDLFRKLDSLSNHLFGLPYESKLKNSTEVLFNQPNLEFSEVLEEYGSKMTKLSKRIIEVVLMSLGDGFEKKFDEYEFSNCHGYLRINNYSPPDQSMKVEVEGLGKHTDMSCVTIVYQDEMGGLQVRSKEGKWMDINPCEGTLVVNIGDLMQAWSNGKLRSSEHRVVLKHSVNRLSLAFFWCFEDDKVVFAPDEVVGEGILRMYRPFVCVDYLKFRESTEKGKFEKVGFTVKEFAGTRG